jgi:hypothetical protein
LNDFPGEGAVVDPEGLSHRTLGVVQARLGTFHLVVDLLDAGAIYSAAIFNTPLDRLALVSVDLVDGLVHIKRLLVSRLRLNQLPLRGRGPEQIRRHCPLLAGWCQGAWLLRVFPNPLPDVGLEAARTERVVLARPQELPCLFKTDLRHLGPPNREVVVAQPWLTHRTVQ